MTSRKVMAQTTKWSTSPELPKLKTMENHHGAHFQMRGQNSTYMQLISLERKFYILLRIRVQNGQISSY